MSKKKKKKQALPELFNTSFNLGNRRLLGDGWVPPGQENDALEALAKLDEALKAADVRGKDSSTESPMKIHSQDAAVFFGSPTAPLPDWRDGRPVSGQDDVDPDDEELDVTPPDVVAVLGFDPKELDEIEAKAFCPTRPGGGIDSSCSSKPDEGDSV